MRENNRVYATLVIWFTFAVMTLGLFTIPTSVFNDASSGILLGVLIVLAIAATLAMGVFLGTRLKEREA